MYRTFHLAFFPPSVPCFLCAAYFLSICTIYCIFYLDIPFWTSFFHLKPWRVRSIPYNLLFRSISLFDSSRDSASPQPATRTGTITTYINVYAFVPVLGSLISDTGRCPKTAMATFFPCMINPVWMVLYS